MDLSWQLASVGLAFIAGAGSMVVSCYGVNRRNVAAVRREWEKALVDEMGTVDRMKENAGKARATIDGIRHDLASLEKSLERICEKTDSARQDENG